MALIGINLKEGKLQGQEIIVGIDLGTTHSLVAMIDTSTGEPIALQDANKETLVPSMIYFGEQNEIKVGKQAKPYLITDPENTIFSVKRLMGKSYADLLQSSWKPAYRIHDGGDEQLVKVQIGDQFYNPVNLSALILKELKFRAEQFTGKQVNKAVITVPAYFNDAQRQATRDAGKLAGLDVLRIINEPTAASLAYGIGRKEGETTTLAVYDLGGGTFDISILRIESGVFEVLSTHGDTYLGGDDIDQAIADFFLKQHQIDQQQLSREERQWFRLGAERAKKAMSNQDDYTEIIAGFACRMNKEEFNELVNPFIQVTLLSCRQALADAGLTPSEIQEVIMVGGSTRIQAIRDAVSSFFEKPLHLDLNPDEVVALGAAIQADILAGNQKDMLLLDITPLSLGIETMGGLMDVIIPRNSKVPTSAGRQYTTSLDGQSKLQISVFQGERDEVQHNRKLASFILEGIPPMPAGLPKVDIRFVLNADGILTVSATELRSGVKQSIEVQPQYGLSEEDMSAMLISSLQHAKEDMATRALLEARVEAQQLADAAVRFIQKNNTLLSTEEISQTEVYVQAIHRVLNSTDKDAILAAVTDLNDYTRPFAERIMDAAIGAAMKGKSLSS